MDTEDIIVTGPDGDTISFPAGTAREKIEAVARRQFTGRTEPRTGPPEPTDRFRFASPDAFPPEPEREREPSPTGPTARDDLGEFIMSLGTRERQAIYDFIGQTFGTSIGMAAGAPGGPPGMALGGGGGNLAGKIAARSIGPWIGGHNEDIGALEGGVDAVLGTTGPAVSQVAKFGKSVARSLTGVTDKAAKEARVAGAAEAGMAENVGERAGLRSAAEVHSVKTASGKEFERQGVGSAAQTGGQLASLAHLVTTGDLGGAALWLAGGKAASVAQEAAARKLLSNPKIADWIIADRSTR